MRLGYSRRGEERAVYCTAPHDYLVDPFMTGGVDSEDLEGRLVDRARLFEDLARELRSIAGAIASRRDTVQPTALVNEAFLKLSASKSCWNDRSHFLRAAAVTMKSILLDHKKARNARKRGGGACHEALDEALHYLEASCGTDVEHVHAALTALAEEDAELAEYVNLRFFAGRTNAEAADALGISERTGVRYWDFARAWLHRHLTS